MAGRKPSTPAKPARRAKAPPAAANDERSPSDYGAPEYYAKDRKPSVAKPQTRH